MPKNTTGPKQGPDQNVIVDSEINSPTPGLPGIVGIARGTAARLRDDRRERLAQRGAVALKLQADRRAR